MSVASISTISASSPESWQDALQRGLERATKTVRGIREMEVVSERARVDGDAIVEYLVELKIIFDLEG